MKNSIRLTVRVLVTAVALVAAVLAGRGLWNHYMDDPWTRDGHVRADVVDVTPDVSGLVGKVVVHDNQPVERGDVLFVVDQKRFEIAVTQAEAVVAGRKATLEQAKREQVRLEKLSTFASGQQKEQAEATVAEDQASYQQALSDLDLARLNLDRSEVRAPVNGIITNFSLRPGDYVTAGKAEVALIDTDTLRIEGYFEETKLPRIHVGAPATIRLMGHQALLLGHVESISAGIEDQNRSDGANLLANVDATFDWVRLAQRVPVRIALDKVPADINLVTGLTATIRIGPETDESRRSASSAKVKGGSGA